jgi:hypothetical protein
MEYGEFLQLLCRDFFIVPDLLNKILWRLVIKLTARWFYEPEYESSKCRFSASRFTNKSNNLSPVYDNVNIVKGLDIEFLP